MYFAFSQFCVILQNCENFSMYTEIPAAFSLTLEDMKKICNTIQQLKNEAVKRHLSKMEQALSEGNSVSVESYEAGIMDVYVPHTSHNHL